MSSSPLLRINQNGFCEGRDVVAGTNTSIEASSREYKHQKIFQQYLLFVDFRKTFDSVHRGKLMADKIVSTTNVLYIDTEAKVLSPDGDT